ncbi:MAG: hypothetical protein JST16_05900 [Bdellovibrionales bacterium]|nr:hypothetical protein [Bdellovibrionales bacterium]
MKFKNTLISIARGLFVFSALGGLAYGARAAVYNLYFNNNEQGDNSTSTPSVVVKDGKDKDEDETDSNTEETNKPEEKKAEEAKPAPQEPAVTTTAAQSALASTDYTWRVGLTLGGYSSGDSSRYSYSPSYPNGAYDYAYSHGGYASVSLGYFPVQKFGINAYALLGIPKQSTYRYSSHSGYAENNDSRYALGAELEFNPLRFKSGQGHEVLELGLTLGASSLMHDEGGWTDLMHLGLRGAYNFSSGWGLVGIWRISPMYQSFDMGINFLF